MKTESHIDFKNGILDISSPQNGTMGLEGVIDAFIDFEKYGVKVKTVRMNESTFRNIKSNSFYSTNIEELSKTGDNVTLLGSLVHVSEDTDIWMSNEEPGHGG